MKTKTNEELSKDVFWLKVDIVVLMIALGFMCYITSRAVDKISELSKPQTISNPYKAEVLLEV